MRWRTTTDGDVGRRGEGLGALWKDEMTFALLKMARQPTEKPGEEDFLRFPAKNQDI